jgi:hypothetical protein
MKSYSKYERIIAIKEMSAGNESVGSMWVETKTFNPDTPVKEIIKWGNDTDGKLMLTIDSSDAHF